MNFRQKHQVTLAAGELTRVIYSLQLHGRKCPACKYGDGSDCLKAIKFNKEITRLKGSVKIAA